MDNSEYRKLLNDTKAYLGTRYNLLRLELLEKLSRIIGLILLALVVVLLALGAFAFFGMAMVFVLSQVMPLWASCCILGGVFVLVIILAFIFKVQWFIDPAVKSLSKILFAETAETEEVALPKAEEDTTDE